MAGGFVSSISMSRVSSSEGLGSFAQFPCPGSPRAGAWIRSRGFHARGAVAWVRSRSFHGWGLAGFWNRESWNLQSSSWSTFPPSDQPPTGRSTPSLPARGLIDPNDPHNIPEKLLDPITQDALNKAADVWATVRNAELATAHPSALDRDAILAAQTILAANVGDVATIATNNARHLSRFPGIDARPWQFIFS
jgi:hypothetical protein